MNYFDYPATLRLLNDVGRILATASASTMAADDVITISAIFPEWAEGKHTAGSVVQYDAQHDAQPNAQPNMQPWRCLQDHDSTGNPAWRPGVAPSLWGPYHATTAARALPWQAPTGAHDCYNTGEYMVWTDGMTYLCNTDGTVYGPDVLPAAWAKTT